MISNGWYSSRMAPPCTLKFFQVAFQQVGAGDTGAETIDEQTSGAVAAEGFVEANDDAVAVLRTLRPTR